MRQILSKVLAPETQNYLDNLQSEIINGSQTDTDTSFAAQVRRATKKWKPNNAHFDKVKEALQDMTIAGRCNYCESDRACDIEHIYPKSKFPELAYTWTNYILACSYCNSYLKNDKFAVFSPSGSSTKLDLERNDKDAPLSNDGLLINPRLENPQDFIRLVIIKKTCFYQPIRFDITTRDYQRAHYTIELLDLNNETLIQQMHNQLQFFTSMLRTYKMVKEATDFGTLNEAISSDFPFIDENEGFLVEQQRILENLSRDIKYALYPTVWDELKRQREHLPNTNELFNAVQEALLW